MAPTNDVVKLDTHWDRVAREINAVDIVATHGVNRLLLELRNVAIEKHPTRWQEIYRLDTWTVKVALLAADRAGQRSRELAHA